MVFSAAAETEGSENPVCIEVIDISLSLHRNSLSCMYICLSLNAVIIFKRLVTLWSPDYSV